MENLIDPFVVKETASTANSSVKTAFGSSESGEDPFVILSSCAQSKLTFSTSDAESSIESPGDFKVFALEEKKIDVLPDEIIIETSIDETKPNTTLAIEQQKDCSVAAPNIDFMREFFSSILTNSRSLGNSESFIKKNANGRSTSYNIMKKFVETVPMKIVGEVLYYYDAELCYYRQLTDAEAKRLIMDICREDVEKWGTPSFVKDVYEFITINPDIVGDIHDTIHPNYLGFRNGILDLSRFTFLGPSPKFFITNIVDDVYDPAPTMNCPNFNAFLSQCYGGNAILINRVWEAIGYILTDDINAKCFFLLQGPGDSGKSLLIKLICSFFREDAVCPLMINQFGERFGLSLANGKKLITCADLPRTSLTDAAVATIKCLTGGDAISYEQKYKPMAKFINTAKLIFASNFPITVSSQDQAFFNRMVVIPFLHSVPREKQIKNMYEILRNEKHAIIHCALNAYRELRNRNYVFSGKDYPNYLEQDIVPLLTDEGVIQQFFEKCCCTTDTSKFITTENLHNAYTNFCNDNGYTVLAKEQFSKYFKLKFGDQFTPVKRKILDGASVRGYAGLTLVK